MSSSMLDKFRLTPSPIRIGDKKLELLTVENIEPFLAEIEKQEKGTLESFPYWIKIWEASIILASHLSEQHLDTNKSVLELGAGMGVVGLFRAAFGHRVTLTDYNDDAIALLKKNIAKNNLKSATVKKLDWNAYNAQEKYDIIIGGELVYRQKDIQPVIRVIKECLKPDGMVYLAHNIKQISMIEFLAEAGKYFDIEHAGRSITMGNEKKQVIIHTMTPKR